MEILCRIRDIHRSIIEYEQQFEKTHNLCLNEGMLLCSLSKNEMLTSGEIAELLGLTNSNTSKVIRSVENKKLIKRVLGEKDKRQMYFLITVEGKSKLEAISNIHIEIPELLQSFIDDRLRV